MEAREADTQMLEPQIAANNLELDTHDDSTTTYYYSHYDGKHWHLTPQVGTPSVPTYGQLYLGRK